LSNLLPPLSDILRAHDLFAKRSLGQNFLLDINLTRRIARAISPSDAGDILEIGPGPGGLSRALLLEGAQRIVAVEKDIRFLPILEQIKYAYPGRFDIVSGDALKVNHQSLVHAPARIAANLPYNVATPLLTGWLSCEPWLPWWERAVLMFQREVANRIVAPPGSRAYGRLSVICQFRAKCCILFTVDPRAFTPPPKVTSAVVEIVPCTQSDDDPRIKTLEKITAAAFGQRRKMLRSSLKTLDCDIAALLNAADIDPTWRAEQVSVDKFKCLAKIYEDHFS